MLARGDDKPIWFTEFGWSTTSKQCGVSEATQADYLRRAFEYIKQDPYVEVATWYNFRNNFYDSDADDYEAQFGLMRTDFTKKPAYTAFKTYAQSPTATTPPPAEAPPAEAPPAKRSRVTLRVARTRPVASAASNRSLRAWGRVSASGIRSVRIRVLQQAATGWRTRSTRRVKVRARRFNVRLGGLSAGRYRVQVILPGPAGAPRATRNIRL
jgi:hypothetical protein